jgi:two-component system sensor histidine kinase/response regulator
MNSKFQSPVIWMPMVFLIEVLLRLILILQINNKLAMVYLMTFDITLIFFRKSHFSSSTYEMIFKIVMVYLYQYTAGRVHIFYVFSSSFVFNVTKNGYYYCLLLIMNIFFADFFIGKYEIDESLLVASLILLAISLLYISNVFQQGQTASEKENAREGFTSHFVTIASHELRNPLQALSFLITYLDTFDLSRKEKNIIDDIKSTVSLLISIIDNILDVAKMNSGKMVHKPITMNLVEIVERVACIFYPKAQAKQLNLYVDVDSSIPSELIGDPTLISQVLSNFTSNSLKFTREGRIIISVGLIEEHDGKCTFKISCDDTGIGISLENQADLFRPFGKIQSSDSQAENEGWGLGLAIIKDIVHLMGGNIELKSTLGVGSNFSFTIVLEQATKNTIRGLLLPVYLDSVVIIVREEEGFHILEKYLREMNVKTIINGLANLPVLTNDYYLLIDQKMIPQYMETLEKFTKILYIGEVFDQSSRVLNEPICYLKFNKFLSIEQGVPINIPILEQLGNISILLVEDNILIHRFEVKLLEKNGVKIIRSAYNGIEALELIEKSPPFDVILMDIQMPKMDGIEATKNIRQLKDENKSRVPIIIVTGNTLFDAPACLSIGANSVVSKPVNFKEIILAINKVVRL